MKKIFIALFLLTFALNSKEEKEVPLDTSKTHWRNFSCTYNTKTKKVTCIYKTKTNQNMMGMELSDAPPITIDKTVSLTKKPKALIGTYKINGKKGQIWTTSKSRVAFPAFAQLPE